MNTKSRPGSGIEKRLSNRKVHKLNEKKGHYVPAHEDAAELLSRATTKLNEVYRH